MNKTNAGHILLIIAGIVFVICFPLIAVIILICLVAFYLLGDK